MPEPLRQSIDIAQQCFTPAELDLLSRECWHLDLLPYDDPRIALRFCISQSRYERASNRLADKLVEIDKAVAWTVVRCLRAAEEAAQERPAPDEGFCSSPPAAPLAPGFSV